MRFLLTQKQSPRERERERIFRRLIHDRQLLAGAIYYGHWRRFLDSLKDFDLACRRSVGIHMQILFI